MPSTNKKLIVINVVGLTENMLGKHTPNLLALKQQGFSCPLEGVFPAVTTTSQSSMLTGRPPSEHGIVGNGWYFRELAEVGFWKQANALVQSPKIWDTLKDQFDNFRVSKLFWWYNMYANVDASITPRPHYLADGGKVFDLYSNPQGLHEKIEEKIGKFPFHTFWGPKAGLASSQWIVSAAIEEFTLNQPNLQLVYLPHLDYNLQKLGPNHPDIKHDIQAIDNECGRLIQFAHKENAEVFVVSEYGISEVDTPLHINRLLREYDFIQVRLTNNFENLDYGASDAFAVADHQCAHVYINKPSRLKELKQLLEAQDGIEKVLDKHTQKVLGIEHSRSGDLVLVAKANTWFTYYYWLDDALAPDFARTVDIHRKPGYDPAEMFFDPKIRFPIVKVIGKLIKKKLGFRILMNVIPLDANLIKGSHGRLPDSPKDGAVFIGPKRFEKNGYAIIDVYHLMKRYFSEQ